jgi:hypothetical protein
MHLRVEVVEQILVHQAMHLRVEVVEQILVYEALSY